ncbi:MAG: tetratricopeptide repeat protein [Candidatus Adiutrix sp.]|nr:tetratricopeptide repeat protein [Candidatus Adiutrix sp.]
MGVVDEARRILAPVLNEGVADRLGWEVYARAGMADFYQGFYGQAVDILREVLRRAPQVSKTFPDLLYALGESYHYLNRPDLARYYLTQAINLMPDHPKADIILTRIGDSYRLEGLDREAIAVYGSVRRNYPQGEGGLISQVRLADMGSLHSFFSQEKVFEALERGSRQATVEMYKTIAGSGFHSPLIQLAQLKIGTALAEDGETNEAIKWLRDLEMNDPKSPLLPEALPTLNTALADEMTLRRELGDWQGISDLYADNSYYVANADRPGIERIVAQAYEHLGRFQDARDMWAALAEETPEKRLARAKGLVVNSLKIGRPLDALDYILEMEPEFPAERPWIDEQLALIGRALARPHNADAVRDLLKLREAISAEPVRRDALSDAITIEIEGRRYDRAAALIRQYRQEYPLDELSPEYLLTLAQIADYQKRYDQAWDILSDFRQTYPDDPRGRRLLSDQIAKADQLGRPDDAFRFMELYRDRYPDDPAGRTLLMEKMNRQWAAGRFNDARDTLAAFRRDYPDDPRIPEIIMDLADKDWAKGRYPESQWAVDELIFHYRDYPELLPFLIERSGKNWARERYEDARNLTYSLLANYPGDDRLADLLLKRADDDWSRGRFEAALEDWNDFRLAFPDDPRIGRSYLEQYKKMMAGGFTAEAFRLAEDYRGLRPRDTAGLADLALEEAKDYFALKRPAEGLAKWDYFRRTFPDDPRNSDLLLIQARQELKGGLGAEAAGHYRLFIDRYPGDERLPDVYLETAAALAALTRTEEAWQLLNSYITRFPGHRGRPQAILDAVELGHTLPHLNDAAALLELFRRDYPTSPAAPATFPAEARLQLAAGDQPGAVATLENGVLTQPSLDHDPQVQALLIDLYLEEGRVEDWAALVEKNLDRAASSSDGQADRFQKYYQLAQVYQELGRTAEAERNLDSALANRAPGVSPENIYAVAQNYKQLLRPDKYRSTLMLVQEAADPFWRQVASDELATETTGAPAS